MEDYKYLITIAASIIYFIIKGLSKNKKPTPTQNKSGERAPAKSFEEILAEIAGGQTRPEEDASIDYESSLETAESRPLEQTVSEDDYANADDTLKELYRKGEKLKTINELVNIDEVTTKSHFDAYEEDVEDHDLASEIREGFSNPNTAKKAFIYSEIFTRKY